MFRSANIFRYRADVNDSIYHIYQRNWINRSWRFIVKHAYYQHNMCKFNYFVAFFNFRIIVEFQHLIGLHLFTNGILVFS